MNFDYTVVRKPYRRNATITITEDNRISVVVPKQLPESGIRKLIREKSAWIQKILEKNLKTLHLYQPKKYMSGEAFPFLGTNRRLVLQFESPEGIELAEEELLMRVPFPEKGFDHRKYISSKLNHWGRLEALRILRDRVSFYEAVMGVKSRRVRIKDVKSVWGSCNAKGNLTFNWRIVMAPVPMIDYVVVHELSHLVHHNHSEKFWSCVAAVIPDYKSRRKWLRVNARTLKW